VNHWRASCWINAALLGDPTMPLCARVYRMPPSRFRTAYLRLMDRLFEPDHCMRVYARFLIR